MLARHRPLSQTRVHGPLFLKSSTASLITVQLLLVLGIPAWYELVIPPTPRGLRVRLAIVTRLAAGVEPLHVRVVSRDFALVDGIPTRIEDVAICLRLDNRPRPPLWHPPVYVEGDPDLEWQDVMRVIDIIRGTGAAVILIKSERSARGAPGRSPAAGRKP